jgi:hypothetical protein
MKMRWLVAVGLIAVSFVGAWSFYQRQPAAVSRPVGSRPPASRPLDQVTPEGALLYIEAQDFSKLLNDWNGAPEKAKWLESENNRVFSQSRMFFRLRRFYQSFAVAAGVPPDTEFITDAAGKESVFALYDIGKVEFLYITHLPSTGFLNSVLWRSRNKFQPRSAGGAAFFTRKDEESGQVVAFAVAGDYLLLATREDLMAHALQLLGGQPGRSVQQEEWFSKVVAEAPATKGDLRMVLNLGKITVAPHFRSYWIQQNITEMAGYTSAVSDLYRQGRVYREERVLLRKVQEGAKDETRDEPKDEARDKTRNAIDSSGTVDALLALAPDDSGFYQTSVSTPQEALDVLAQKILSPQASVARTQSQAPQIFLTDGEIGSESDLETRIDVAVAATSKENSFSGLSRQFEQANARVFLVVQGTRRNPDDVLLTIPSVMVIEASHDWNLHALQSALQADLASGLSAATLGLGWKPVDQAGGYFELDGIHPLQLTVRGNLLYIGNQPEMLAAVLQTKNTTVQHVQHLQTQGATYVAGFNHARERKNFYELTAAIDHSAQSASPYQSNQPRLFSQNISSLSRTLARLESEKVVVREVKNKVFQTVIYQWE